MHRNLCVQTMYQRKMKIVSDCIHREMTKKSNWKKFKSKYSSWVYDCAVIRVLCTFSYILKLVSYTLFCFLLSNVFASCKFVFAVIRNCMFLNKHSVVLDSRHTVTLHTIRIVFSVVFSFFIVGCHILPIS